MSLSAWICRILEYCVLSCLLSQNTADYFSFNYTPIIPLKRLRLPVILFILSATILCHPDWRLSLAHEEGLLHVGKHLGGLKKLLSIVWIVGEVDRTSGNSDNRSLHLLPLLSTLILLEVNSWLGWLCGVSGRVAWGPAAGGNANLLRVQDVFDSCSLMSVTVKTKRESSYQSRNHGSRHCHHVHQREQCWWSIHQRCQRCQRWWSTHQREKKRDQQQRSR